MIQRLQAIPFFAVVAAAILCVAATVVPARAETAPLGFQDLMKFRQIENAVISRDGKWIAYGLVPDRGDGEVVVRATSGDAEYRIPRGAKPSISGDSRWVVAAVVPTQQERDEAEGKDEDEAPKPGLALLRTNDGDIETFERVETFAFSEDGRWLAFRRFEEQPDGDDDEEDKPREPEAPTESKESARDDENEENVGTTMVLRDLRTGGAIEIPHVTEFSFDEPATAIVYAVAIPGGESNGLFYRALNKPGTPVRALRVGANGRYTALVWQEKSSRLGFVAAVDGEDHLPGPAEVWAWDGTDPSARRLVASEDAPDGWYVPSKNELRWSRDGRRLFFGFKPQDPGDDGNDNAEEPSYDPYDVDGLLGKRAVDVWHWNDPFIIPNQKKLWEKEKDRTYPAVAHLESGKVVVLGDLEIQEVVTNENPQTGLGRTDVPYRREMTWNGPREDVWALDLETGRRRLVAEHLSEPASLSPEGRFAVYWDEGHWFLYDVDHASTRNLTAGLDVTFADEDHDYPAPPPGYGIADWVEGDVAVLVYDKYDIWQFSTADGDPVCITGGEGRSGTRQFRVLDLDPERDFVRPGERLLLSSYHDRHKNWGFYEATVGGTGVGRLVEDDKRFRFVAKAEDADVLLYTRESYTEFPDLWTAGPDLSGAIRRSDANPWIGRFAWGDAELVEWTAIDGKALQGVLIRPGNSTPGKRYPVLVYFYRLFSQRLHEFNEPVINHRPSFPVYASDGYAVFLPDIRFEIGNPGNSATAALVSGVGKLVDMGIADPDAIGLHGHSWSGYLTAYVVTRTDVFSAAVAGAPVANMTSAYSGIRLETGLSRQFQYEVGQSRIGASLSAKPEKYIENSPVFHADRVETPLLVQFGDRDEAVPWQQGIELYLAMRRLDKNCIFLQYRDEPHHLKKYPNKLDYSIKMKEFFDHYLKGSPAPAWMTEGVPYRGK